MLTVLNELKQQQIISESDFYFAKLIADKQQGFGYDEQTQNLAIFLAALCNFHYQQGNTCLGLRDNLLHQAFDLSYRATEVDYLAIIQQKIGNLEVNQWQNLLQHHIAFSVDPQHKIVPFVFQHNALYFYRIWQEELDIADYLKSAVKNHCTFEPQDIQQIAAYLAWFFPKENPEKANNQVKTDNQENAEIDWQKIAVATALRQHFCVIAGGPGTGKTTTVARLLAVLQLIQGEKLRIKLAAPTGKAAARLTESLANALDKIRADLQGKSVFSSANSGEDNLPADQVLAQMPTSAETIHRLLGIRLFSDTPKFNKHNPLPIDLLILDEASMVDLSLMAKLINALKPETKLILLGDKDQLSAVEAGAILSEISALKNGTSSPMIDYLQQTTSYNTAELQGAEATELKRTEAPVWAALNNPLSDSLCFLQKSYRAKNAPWIMLLADLINQGKGKKSWQLLNAPPQEWIATWQTQHIQGLICHELTPSTAAVKQTEIKKIVNFAVEQYSRYLNLVKNLGRREPHTDELSEIFSAFNSIRFLTALRIGDVGVENLNQQIAEGLRQKGLIQFYQAREWYIGKAIMISENDESVKLYNGDIGLYLSAGRVYFEQSEGNYRAVMTSRIPTHEPAFVMTVHKSQGSEFNHTVFVLPTEFSPILSKELIYTAITRAKMQLTIFANSQIWESAVKKSVKRESGLGRLLAEG